MRLEGYKEHYVWRTSTTEIPKFSIRLGQLHEFCISAEELSELCLQEIDFTQVLDIPYGYDGYIPKSLWGEDRIEMSEILTICDIYTHLPPSHLKQILTLKPQYKCDKERFSDLDLCVAEKIKYSTRSFLETESEAWPEDPEIVSLLNDAWNWTYHTVKMNDSIEFSKQLEYANDNHDVRYHKTRSNQIILLIDQLCSKFPKTTKSLAMNIAEDAVTCTEYLIANVYADQPILELKSYAFFKIIFGRRERFKQREEL